MRTWANATWDLESRCASLRCVRHALRASELVHTCTRMRLNPDYGLLTCSKFGCLTRTRRARARRTRRRSFARRGAQRHPRLLAVCPQLRARRIRTSHIGRTEAPHSYVLSIPSLLSSLIIITTTTSASGRQPTPMTITYLKEQG